MKEPLNIPYNIQKSYKELLAFKESRRSQDEIISDIIAFIKDLKKDTFLPFILDLIMHIDLRNVANVFSNLKSPMKQLAYIIELYMHYNENGYKKDLTEQEWMRVTELLNEIEMTYFADIGFFDEENIDKISVSLITFLDYFANAQISFDEQTLERFNRNCGAFDEEVKKLFGFSTNDAIEFCLYVRNLINQKLNHCNYYMLNPEEWPKLTAKFIQKGLRDPKSWWNEPELALMKEYRTQPGCIFVHNKDEIKRAPLNELAIKNILEFLTFKVTTSPNTIYYADNNIYFDTPLIELNKSEYLCPPYKFLIECFYNKINEKLKQHLENKYLDFRSESLEIKVKELFISLFGKDVQIFSSYYCDENRSEQDILVYYKRFYFIIEVKDVSFRPPMRHPLKAYEKIKSDFKKSIQYGYNQCKRIEDKIIEGQSFNIFDCDTGELLHIINPSKIENYFSIVVTQFKYGGIQTNLENLLDIEDENLFPWSVCIDDLEAFILLLLKLKRGMAKSMFIEFLKYRESYHGKIICSDELELVGFFINDMINFKKFALSDDLFTTFPGMSDVFDAEYKNGLGFSNELDIKIKRTYPVPKYEKKFDFSIFNHDDLKRLS